MAIPVSVALPIALEHSESRQRPGAHGLTKRSNQSLPMRSLNEVNEPWVLLVAHPEVARDRRGGTQGEGSDRQRGVPSAARREETGAIAAKIGPLRTAAQRVYSLERLHGPLFEHHETKRATADQLDEGIGDTFV